MKTNSKFIIISSIICIIACIGEFVFMFILGAFYPGYNQLKDTMSSLGASISPVSNIISVWWVIMGVLFIIFGAGFKKAFQEKRIYTDICALLIILYGLGEGIGSGLFKANHIVDTDNLTLSGVIHDIVGGIGVTAILIFPLLMQKVITTNENTSFKKLSQIVFVLGIVSILLFLFRFSGDGNNFLTTYKGLWQRLFMLNTYIYFSIIAVLMIKKQIRN